MVKSVESSLGKVDLGAQARCFMDWVACFADEERETLNALTELREALKKVDECAKNLPNVAPALHALLSRYPYLELRATTMEARTHTQRLIEKAVCAKLNELLQTAR